MTIGSSTNVSRYQYTNQMKKTEKNKEKTQEKLSSGKKINRAADDAAGLAISNKMMKQIKALDQGSNNILSGVDMTKISDGAMQSVSENLLDLQTDSIRAMNGTMSSDDKAILQQNASATIGTINHVATSTKFNEKNLLDGSSKNTNIYTGTSSEMLSAADMSVESLGLQDFSLTDDKIDTTALDQASQYVSSARSTQGAQMNGLESSYQVNQVASENTTAAYSRKMDTDMGKAITQHKTASLVNEAQNKVMKSKMNQEADMVSKLFG